YHRAGNGDVFDRHQVFQGEMQANAKHQQDHADLGDLVGEFLVCDETRGEWTDNDTCQQVAHKRREAPAVGQSATKERQDEACGNGGDQGCVMGHSVSRRRINRSAAKRIRAGMENYAISTNNLQQLLSYNVITLIQDIKPGLCVGSAVVLELLVARLQLL